MTRFSTEPDGRCHRTRQLMREAGITAGVIMWPLLGSVPFWIAAVIWSRRVYAALPNQAPGCFVVTAAAQGHVAVVGARLPVEHCGEERLATRQLHTLWRFEALWARRAPQGHAAFRRLYNQVGPRMAARITTPFRADLAYLALKPVEVLARVVLKNVQPRQGEG